MTELALPPKIDIAGVGISALTFDESMRLFLDAPASDTRLSVHFCTVHTVVEASRNERLGLALRHSALAVPDGMPLVWAGRIAGAHLGRVCGLDVLPALVDRARGPGYRHFFYGGAPGVAEELARRMSRQYPGVRVAGIYSPPFHAPTPDEDRLDVERINASRADYVWVGLGTPKQDLWLASHREHLSAAVLLAVGAAFDVHSGRLRRAPAAMQRTGTEWLFRLALEPRRLLYRYSVVNAQFLVRAGPEALGRALRRCARA